MPVSHIGLTVSHLPTSCSFFLAALTPLGFRYLGQFDGQIGFGIDTPEFFISQETASTKAGAAHIAFDAPSRSSVDAFFVAALKAGGRIHGEPAERDAASGYYSAAVLDFDENSIEVMHRREKSRSGHSEPGSEASRVLSWQKKVAKSTVSQDAQSSRPESRVAVTNVLTPTIMVANQAPQAKSGDDKNSKALIGTLLGAAAGAAVAYAMSQGEESSTKAASSIAFQVVEAAKSHLAPSGAAAQPSYPNSMISRSAQRGPQGLERLGSQISASQSFVSYHVPSSHEPMTRLTITAPPPPQASTLIDTLIQPSEVPRYSRHSVSRSQTDGALLSSRHSVAVTQSSSRSKPSRAYSASKVATQAGLGPSTRSSIVTEIRNPRDVPLPTSKSTSVASRREPDLRRVVLDPAHGGDTGTVLDSVAPSDSISQAPSKRSKGSKRSSRHGSRAGSRREDDNASQASERTVKAEKARTGSRRPSIMSLPLRTSSKTSVHRSVVSFLPGM
ncbi:MAG: hypothetical protein Q9219_001013 [cf. Caloplaca sp. 3 TL-2023]